MAGDSVDFCTPIGRLVQGDCFAAQDKDDNGNPRVYTEGPKTGQPKISYFIAVAFAKNDPAWSTFRALIDSTARRDFPHLFPGGGACIRQDFAYKIIDGDSLVPDQNGVLNSTKPGFAGCWVVRFSTMFSPKCFAAGKYQPHEQLQVVGGVNPIPRGYKVRVMGTIRGNDSTKTPGLYVSQTAIEFAAVDTIISSGPNIAAVFGNGAPGAAAAGGLVQVPTSQHTIAACRAGGWTDEQMIAAGVATRAAPAAPPPPPAAPPPPPPPVVPHTAILTGGPVMLPAAGATSYAQYIAGGWTDAALIANGYMQAPAASVPPPLATAGSVPPPPPAATVAAPPPPPPATAKTMLPAAAGQTYEALIAAGWNDALLIQNGYMAG